MGRKLFSRPRSRRARKSGKSPYARHEKTPHRYSSAYYQWRSRVTGKKEAPDQPRSNYRSN